MKKIGLIGGTSWHSTIDYYKGINQLVAQQIGNNVNPELLLHSINIEVMRSGDQPRIIEKYTEVSKSLENQGAEAIVICANTPHLVYEKVQPKLDIPILHIGDAIAQEAIKKDLKSLGLLGTKATMQGSFIKNYIKDKYDIDIILPEENEQPKIHELISKELTQGVFSSSTKAYFLEQISKLAENGADGAILGCTELPMLIKTTDTTTPIISTTDVHIEMAVNFILKNQKKVN